MEDLREQILRLKSIIKGTNLGTWVWNVQTGESTWNEVFCNNLGYTVEELMPMSVNKWKELVHPEDGELAIQLAEKLMNKEISEYEHEHRLKHKNGNWIWVLDRGAISKWDEDGNPLIMSGAHIVIDERKKAEAALLHRDSILNAVSFSANVLLKDLNEQNLAEMLEAFGEASNASRAYIFEVYTKEESLFASQRYEWCSDEVEPQIDNPDLQDAPFEQLGFERWHQVLSTGGMLSGSVDSFPEEEQEVLKAQEITSILILPIFVGDDWWGFIGFDQCKDDVEWSEIEVEALRTSANIFGSGLSRLRHERSLKDSLVEKETLLAEIHHRVKNNLAVVSGVMQLQSQSSTNQELKEELTNSINRIQTIAAVHELLYKTESFSSLVFADNIRKLCEQLSKTFDPDNAVKLYLKLDKVSLDVVKALPASLIVNEVLTNIYKHAFTHGEQGEISIRLEQKPDAQVTLEIEDNGVGFSETELKSGNSLGLRLIDILSQQLEAEYTFTHPDSESGTVFTLRFSSK
ncbi:MAG: PAS domain-containing protein [Balneolaceae bacterium]|nr:PAS domain-containing protein [Balneolaceae bacterium]